MSQIDPGASTGLRHERAGDGHVYIGEVGRATRAYGSAIDGYLDAQEYEAAINACRKLIRIAPTVVRTHFTLAYLLLGQGRQAEAAAALERYVDAVQRTGHHPFAVPRLSLVAHTSDDAALQGMVADLLQRLGARGEAERVRASAGTWSPDGDGVRERWERLLEVALRDP